MTDAKWFCPRNSLGHHWITTKMDEDMDGIPMVKRCEYCGAQENIYEEMKRLQAKLAKFGKHL